MSGTRQVYVIGGGGHAKVVVSALRTLGRTVATVFDDNPERWEKSLLGAPILGPVQRIEEYPRLPTVIAIGDNARRRSLAARLDLAWMTVVHPRAFVDPSVRLGRGVVVMAGAVVQVDSSLGDHAIVNTSASVDHDCVVGDFAHVAPGSHLAGNVIVEEGGMFGIGAVAAPGVTVGAWTIVGAQAAVVRNLPARVLAAGVPAEVKKQMDESSAVWPNVNAGFATPGDSSRWSSPKPWP